MSALQHSGGAPNISPDPGYVDEDPYDEWDNANNYEPPPAHPPPPMHAGNEQHFQVRCNF